MGGRGRRGTIWLKKHFYSLPFPFLHTNLHWFYYTVLKSSALYLGNFIKKEEHLTNIKGYQGEAYIHIYIYAYVKYTFYSKTVFLT